MEDATLIKRIDTPFILRAKANGEEFPLRGEMLVGREAECAIPLNSGHISRYHAKINVSHNGIYIEDLQSTNGTSVNGRKIKGRVKLSVGDEVGFDDLYFKVTSATPSDAGKTALSSQRRIAPEDDSTRPMPKAVTPIRPSLVAVDAVKVPADAPAQQGEAQAHFPKADDIDLERPLSSRHALAGDPDFEKHLEQRFSELDALIDLDLDEGSVNRTVSEQEKPKPSVDAPLPRVSANDALASEPTPQDLPATTEKAPEEHTQILSTVQLDQFIERHRHDHDINIGSGPRLIVTTAPLRGKLFSLNGHASGTSLQLGREPGAEIYLNDLTISTDHARITKTPLEFILTATHAKNGLQVNGISQTRVSLQHNDRIQIGRTELVFKTDEGANESKQIDVGDPLVKGQGRSYSLVITLIALIVLVGAIVATAG